MSIRLSPVQTKLTLQEFRSKSEQTVTGKWNVKYINEIAQVRSAAEAISYIEHGHPGNKMCILLKICGKLFDR